MTKKQVKYGFLMLLFAVFLIMDKVMDLWHGWYFLDTIGLVAYTWMFIHESEDRETK